MRRTSQAGLTLLEMMVVLMLAGMALTLAFQSLGQWQRAEASLHVAGADVRDAALSEQWWREAIRGIQPRLDERFRGEELYFQATTTAPVLVHPAAAVEQQWTLVRSDERFSLKLEESGRTFELTLPDAESAQFIYLDTRGRPHTQWPPRLGEQAALPAGIALQLTNDQSADRLWLSAIVGSPTPLLQPFMAEEE